MPGEFPIQTIRNYACAAYKLGYGIPAIERDLVSLTMIPFPLMDGILEQVQVPSRLGAPIFDHSLICIAQRVILYAEQFRILGRGDYSPSAIAQYLRENTYHPLAEPEISANLADKDYLKVLGNNIVTTIVLDANLERKLSDYVQRAHRIGYTWFEIQRALSSSRMSLTSGSFGRLLSRHHVHHIPQNETGHVREGEAMRNFIRNADLIGMEVDEIIFRCLILGYSRPVESPEDVDTLVESWKNQHLIRGSSGLGPRRVNESDDGSDTVIPEIAQLGSGTVISRKSSSTSNYNAGAYMGYYCLPPANSTLSRV